MVFSSLRTQCQREAATHKSKCCMVPAQLAHIWPIGNEQTNSFSRWTQIHLYSGKKIQKYRFSGEKKQVRRQLWLSLFYFCWLNSSTCFRSWQIVKIHFIVIVREIRKSSADRTKDCILKISKLARNVPEINWIYCQNVLSSYIPNRRINPFGNQNLGSYSIYMSLEIYQEPVYRPELRSPWLWASHWF